MNGSMQALRAPLLWAATAVLALAQSGCTFFACPGGGPLARAELGDWAGIPADPVPPPDQLDALVKELTGLRNRPFAGEFSLRGDASLFSLNCGQIFEVPFTPAVGLTVKGRINHWLFFVPGGQRGDWLFLHPTRKDARQVYASEHEWDCLVAWGERANAYDVASRERVAARQTQELIGFGLGWTRVRRIRPLDVSGEPGLNALTDPKVDLAGVRYDLRDGNILLLGVVGWGRVNRQRYVQVLWIPIPAGRAAVPLAGPPK